MKGAHHAKADFWIICCAASNTARGLVCTSTRARIQAGSRVLFEGVRLVVAGMIEAGYSLASRSIFDSLELQSSVLVIGLFTKESWYAIKSVPGSPSLAETFPRKWRGTGRGGAEAFTTRAVQTSTLRCRLIAHLSLITMLMVGYRCQRGRAFPSVKFYAAVMQLW